MDAKSLSKTVLVASTMAGLWLTALPHAAGAANDRRSIEASYRVDWITIPLMHADFRAERSPGRYRVSLQAKGAFLMRWLVRDRLRMVSTGRVADGQWKPVLSEQLFLRSGKRDLTITTRFDKEGALPVASVVPPEGRNHRPPVPPALLSDVSDPLTALLRAISSPMSAKPCHVDSRVYDGRRRVDLHSRLAGTVQLPSIGIAGLPRTGYRCRVTVKRLAGFRDKHFKQLPEPLAPATVIVAKMPDLGLWLTTFIGIESPYGPVSVRLMRLDDRHWRR